MMDDYQREAQEAGREAARERAARITDALAAEDDAISGDALADAITTGLILCWHYAGTHGAIIRDEQRAAK